MDNILTIFLLTAFATLYGSIKASRGSLTVARIFNEVCYRPSTVVEGTLVKFIYTLANEYRAKCVVPDGDSEITVEVDVPDKMFAVIDMGESSRAVHLLKVDVGSGYYYQLTPSIPNGVAVTVEHKKMEGYQKSALAADVFGRRAERFYVLGYLLAILSLPFAASSPFLSFFLVVLAAIIFYAVSPFRKLTNRAKYGIMSKGNKNNKKGKDASAAVNPELPKGYNDWSDTEKELYNIEARIGARAIMPSEEFGKLDKEEEPGTAKNWEYAGNIDEDDFKTDSDEPEHTMFHVCKRCGCVVERDAIFCSSCGAKLSDEISVPVESTPVEEKTETEPDKKTDKKPVKKTGEKKTTRSRSRGSRRGGTAKKTQDSDMDELLEQVGADN